MNVMEVMDNAIVDALHKLNRCFLWSEGKGKLANITATHTSATAVPVDDTSRFLVGQLVDFRDSTGVYTDADHLNFTISSIDETNSTITGTVASGGDGTLALNTSYAVYDARAYQASSTNRAITSIPQIVTAGTSNNSLQGVDPASYAFWQANSEAASGGKIGIKQIIRFLDKLDRLGANMDSVAMFCDYDTRTHIFEGMVNQTQTTQDRAVMPVWIGGRSSMPIVWGNREIPLHIDEYCGKGKLWVIDFSHIFLYQSGPLHWQQLDGKIWKQKDGYDAAYAYLAWYLQLVTDRRNVHGVITGIAGPETA